jgi:hypothetical protein
MVARTITRVRANVDPQKESVTAGDIDGSVPRRGEETNAAIGHRRRHRERELGDSRHDGVRRRAPRPTANRSHQRLPTHPHHHEGSWSVDRYLDSPWSKPISLADAIALIERARIAAERGRA